MECWACSKRKSLQYSLLMLMMIHILVAGHTQGDCVEEERKALLEIKASHMKSYDSEIDKFLPTWVDYGSGTPGDGGNNCCDWERINCSTTTGHVTELSLYNLRGAKDVYMDDENKLWPLNVSLFLHFKELTSLNLSDNFLDKEFIKTGLERLSSLKKLEVLDLSWNYDIDNGILPSLRTLTSLKVLDLSFTSLNGNFPISEFAALENLEMLDLSSCGFNGTFEVQGSERVSVLRKLKTLNLAGNRFNESIIRSLNTLSSLTSLDLSHSLMSGPFPAQEFAALENLEMLDLSHCGFNGTFEIQGSERVSILRKLKTLNLAHNRFNESIIRSLNTLSSLTSLDLSDNSMSGPFPAQELSHLTNLEELDLSSTQLNDTPNIQACKTVLRLKRLKSINLSSNSINKSVISCLSVLPSLKNLDLSYCSLGSFFPVQEFLNLSDLEVLLLTDNYFYGVIPMEAFASFHHLKVLDLSGNSFVGSIPSTIQALSSLRALSFAYNQLNGSLPDHGLCELKNLNELDLSHNMLHGTLPRCLKNLSSLKLLDISSNQFSGILVSSLIANLTSLEYIDSSHNKFEGSFLFSSFSNHIKLEVVRFRSDNDIFEVLTEEPIGWIPMFQLEILELSNCNMKMFPGFLLHQRKLQQVDMSHNSLEGQVPNWLIKNNKNLEVLRLRNNSFDSMPLYRNANTKWLDMSGNGMIVTIPDKLPEFFPNIEYLNLSMNSLSGVIPSSISELSELETLDLSNNELSGEVSKGLLTNISKLNLLKLSNNSLHGQVLSGNLSLSSLQYVYLDGNHFKGKIGTKSKGYDLLITLDISNNLFTGMIPDWISNMSMLSELVVRNNSFEGIFPCGVASFSFLDISQNSFSGPIPSCFNSQYMKHLHLGSNRFTGSIPKFFRNLTEVLTLDIGNNNLSGRIPKFIGELSDLRILLLRKNNFTGSIPKQLCQLSDVSLLDLSYNSLSGSIPSCLQNITGPTDLAFLKEFQITFSIDSSFHYWGIQRVRSIPTGIDVLETEDEVQYTTKRLSLSYKGGILDYMAGLDFSCNKLSGEIPQQLGFLTQLRALNLSHNQLTGPIPVSFSNLAKIESLDLSSNGLTGKVPSQLIKLSSLSTFIVSHNNLSGRLPDMKAQFGTFTEASYEGNPLLCGPPLVKKCTTTNSQLTHPSDGEEENEKWYDIDMACFYGSSSSTCFVFLLGFVALLYINPYWRRKWLDLVEDYMLTCYYFLYDLVRKPYMIIHK
ncbi:receptor-like protein 14 isoform X1 [Lactuca sativa]|uniref:receptor-like protein 14 isoform X1 n=1 Tax=Lactuca sativa TaxID=4236 RepID=UPI0022B0423A|nr:receptor-like protein 14 isoform X1 [Lactuca sativa]